MTDDQSEIGLDAALLLRIDAWRALQKSSTTRSQAVSELVRAGLQGQSNPTLSLGERLILSMLCDVSRKVGSDGLIDPDFLEAAIQGGHSWAIEWEHPSLSHGHTNSQNTADFVIRVLSMWLLVEDSFSKLHEEEKELVRREAGFTGAPSFPGWHSELEANYKSTARFMTDRMNLFPMFEGRAAADSSEPVVGRYKQMLGILAELDRAGTEQPLIGAQLANLLRTS